MMLLGFRAVYNGQFGDVPVIQAGPFQIVHIRSYDRIPLPLAMLLEQARVAGAQFLVIDPRAHDNEKATWVDVREAA